MEKEFVPYELSVKLKELGFDEPCLLHVNHYGEMKETHSSLWMLNGYLAECNDDEKITINYEFPNYPSNKEEYWQEINIPTFSQAFRWFRDTHKMFHEIQIDRTTEPKFCYAVFHYEHYGNYEEIRIREWYLYRTYEEAELACLENLIEVVETKSEQDDKGNE